jgi:histidinol-phosphate aminotransferase
MSHDYEKVFTPADGLRLHLNENTAGCSPKVLAALQSLTREQAAFYPNYDAAIETVASTLGVSPESVLLTNGLDEAILICAVSSLRANDNGPAEAIIITPAFDMYAALADAVGGTIVEVSVLRDLSFPLDDTLRAITPRTRLIFLTSPNNPTGQLIPRADILRVAVAAPQALVFLDEAYADFAGTTLIADAEARTLSNLVIGRTFAKAYGMAALRAGALVAQPQTLASLRRVLPPFSLNIGAVVALPAAVGDREYYAWYLDQVRRSKTLLYEAFEKRRIRYWPSAANFVLADFGDAAGRLVEGLAARHIFVRDKSRDPACPGCVRITAGVVEHTRQFITALEELL